MGSYERRRNLVRRHDDKLVNVARFRGQLFVCEGNCCCGRTDDGFAPVPVAVYHGEWERRRLRNVVHLTVGGCLGPCALANVALLLFDGAAFWFHSVNSGAIVMQIYDFVELMLYAGGVLSVPGELAALQFTASAWQERPDGEPVDDHRTRRTSTLSKDRDGAVISVSGTAAPDAPADRAVADMQGEIAAPRKNGELVFSAPWEGRAFGMAVALNEAGVFPWDDFRGQLVANISDADARREESTYYERWLAAFEGLLEEKKLVTREEIEERTYQFEFGERDDIF